MPRQQAPPTHHHMETVTVLLTLICLLVPTLLLVFHRCNKGKRKTKKERTYLLFIDAPDPDNPAAALALWNHLLTSLSIPHLHIVLTGRPVNLRTKKEFKKDLPVRDQIQRRVWECSVASHTRKLLTDSAARIHNYLTSCGVSRDSITVYDGGVAPCAPISDVVHDWEFLYDRKDLVTGDLSDEGTIISATEYEYFVSKFNLLTDDEREETFLDLLRDYKLTPLSQLRVSLKKPECEEICVLLGGPATSVVELFQGAQNASLRSKVRELFAMFGALSPNKSTLLGNQFNAACDMESAAQLFLEDFFPNTPAYIVPTETAKQPELLVSAEELERRGAHPYVFSLMKLWEATHGGRPQPIFDVFPVMAAVPEFKDVFSWTKKKAIIQEWRHEGHVRQQFVFTDSDKGSLYVAESSFSKECFMQFLDLCFKS